MTEVASLTVCKDDNLSPREVYDVLYLASGVDLKNVFDEILLDLRLMHEINVFWCSN